MTQLNSFPRTTVMNRALDDAAATLESDNLVAFTPSHLDYDLHPLVVPGLEHYLTRDEGDRFHIR